MTSGTPLAAPRQTHRYPCRIAEVVMPSSALLRFFNALDQTHDPLHFHTPVSSLPSPHSPLLQPQPLSPGETESDALQLLAPTESRAA
jgi:hypothetical protein